MENSNEISLPEKIDLLIHDDHAQNKEAIKEKLAALINDLIIHDFNSLVQLLYRIDVDEKKLKLLLQNQSDTDTASIMADLIIKRQLQKTGTKKMIKKLEKNDENEYW